MKINIFKLALRSLWCDLRHSVKGFEVVGLSLFVVFLFLRVRTMGAVFGMLWFWEFSIRRFMPICEKMYYVMALSKKDRARLMRYRVVIVQGVAMLIGGLFIPVQYGIYGEIEATGLQVVFLMLILLEVLWATVFAGDYPEISMGKKSSFIFLEVLSLIAFAVGETLSLCGGRFYKASVVITLISWLVLLAIRVYLMAHAHYEEYRPVNLIGEAAASGQQKEQDW